jgi:hypothetical protein
MTKDKDLIPKTVLAPDWLQKAWAGAKQRGVDRLTDDINAEIDAVRTKEPGSRKRG